MTDVNQAKFTIDGDPAVDPTSGDQGYDATNSQTLDLTLEVNPSPALSISYEVYDPNDSSSPLASLGAPNLTFVASGTARQNLSNPNDTAQIIMPVTGVHTYEIRCTAVMPDGPDTFSRLVVIRSVGLSTEIRKMIPAETQQYAVRSWSDAQNEMVDAIISSVGGLVGLDEAYDKGGSGLGRVIAADSGAVEITGSGTSAAALDLTIDATAKKTGLLITNNDTTGTADSIVFGGNESHTIELASNAVSNKTLAVNVVNSGSGSALLTADADGISLDAAGIASNFTVDSADLTLSTTTSGDLVLNSDGAITFEDQYKAGSTYTSDFAWSGSSAEWDTFETNFGEVSALNAFNQLSAEITAEDLWDRTGSNLYPKNIGDSLGVGISIPLNRLHVSEDSGSCAAQFERSGSSAQADIKINNDTDAFYLGIDENEHFRVSPNGDFSVDTTFILKRTGEAGFGTDTPSGRFHIVSSGQTEVYFESAEDSDCLLQWQGDGTGTEFFAGRIDTGGADRFAVGRRGIAEDLVLLNNGLIVLGSGGASHPLGSPGDLLINGKLEVNNECYLDQQTHIYDNINLFFGASDDAFFSWKTNQTPDTLFLGVGSSSRALLIGEAGDESTDFGQAQRANPTLILQSADATDTDQFVSLSHNQSGALEEIGKGIKVHEHQTLVTIADDATSAVFPAPIDGNHEVIGFGEIIMHEGSLPGEREYAHFSFWGSTVTLQTSTAKVATSDTDGNLCIYHNGTKIVIKNRLGIECEMMLRYHYSDAEAIPI